MLSTQDCTFLYQKILDSGNICIAVELALQYAEQRHPNIINEIPGRNIRLKKKMYKQAIVYDDFIHNKDQSVNEKLCKVRTIFDGYNLISAIHSLMSRIDKSYSNILPPLSLLNNKDCQKLIEDLKKIDFNYKN